MKKLIALLLALALASTLTLSALAESGQTEAKPEDTPIVIVMGTLSMLNMTEEEYAALQKPEK